MFGAPGGNDSAVGAPGLQEKLPVGRIGQAGCAVLEQLIGLLERRLRALISEGL